MTPVTVAAGDVVAASSGTTGWSARALLRPTTVDGRTAQGLGQVFNGGSGSNGRLAQLFRPKADGTLSDIQLQFQNHVGSPTGDIYIEIQTNSGGNLPSGTVIATSDAIAASTVNSKFPTFVFSSPPSLTADTWYWAVLHRTVADGSNRPVPNLGTDNGYFGYFRAWNGSAWGGSSSDSLSFRARFVYPSTAPLYVVTQDSSLHMWRSLDDGATWTEQNSGGAPSVSSSAYPFSAYVSDFHASRILVAYFSATNTLRVRGFNFDANTWDSQDIGNANATTDAENTRPIRVNHSRAPSGATASIAVVNYTSLADTADLGYAHRSIATWGGGTTLAITNADASSIADVVTDDAGFTQRFFYDVNADDFSLRSHNSSDTQGTMVDLDATVATTTAGHASAAYESHLVSGVTRVTAAYIDSNNTINERTASLDVTSASVTFGTQRQVTTSTAYSGGKLSTCANDGDRYCFASNAAGTSIDYWISTDDTTSNTWSSGGNVASGSGLHLSQALPTADGIILLYQSGSNVVVDWAVDGPGGGAVNDSGTISQGTIATSGQSITATATVSATGAVSVGTITASGQSVTATVAVSDSANITAGTIAASGQSISGAFGVSDSATVSTGTMDATGQSVSGAFTVSATGTASAGTAAATGEAITGAFGQSVGATVSVGTVAASGQSVTAEAGISDAATVSAGTISATGETAAAAYGVTASVSAGAIAATGETVAASAGGSVAGSVSAGTISATGETIFATGTESVSASINPGTIVASGQNVTTEAGSSASASIDPGTIVATGETVSASSGVSVAAIITLGGITASGAGVSASATASASASIAPGTVIAIGQHVNATAGESVSASVQEGAIAATGVLVTASATVSAAGSVSEGTITASGYLITAGSGVSVTIEPATIAATGYTLFVGDPPPTEFGELIAGTVRSERALSAGLRADAALSATLAAESTVTGWIQGDRTLTAAMRDMRVLTARLRVNE